MSAEYIVMACPVGTSLLGHISKATQNNEAWVKHLQDKLAIQEKSAIEDCVMEEFTDKAADMWFDAFKGEKPLRLRDESLPTAELQSIVRWLGDSGFSGVIELHLLPSKDIDSRASSRVTAHMTRSFLREAKKRGFANIGGIFIETLPIMVSDEEKFNESIDALFRKYDALREKYGDIIINSTGGFKAICAFSSIYAQVHGLKCIYTFETKDNTAIELPPLPIGYALESLDDEISILKGLEEQNQLQDIDRAVLSPWLRNLIRGNNKLSPLANMLLEHYEKHRHTSDAIGSGMLDQLDDIPMKKYLEELIRGPWSQLWLGDQIPETVEHGRRHSKRLMELAGNLYRCAKIELMDIGMSKHEAIALLIASIYLHDIGHTTMVHPLAGKERGVGVFPLEDFPSCVREVHHLLSAEAIRERADDLFPEPKSVEYNDRMRKIQDMLKILVPYVSEHHRGYTTLTCEQGKSTPREIVALVGKLLYGEKFCDTLQPLERRLKDDGKVKLEEWGLNHDDVVTVAALLRVIDGCDAQVDRTGSDEYAKARFKRTEMEANDIWQELRPFLDLVDPGIKNLTEKISKEAKSGKLSKKDCDDVYKEVMKKLIVLKGNEEVCALTPGNLQDMLTLSMINRHAFKWEQFLHFDKHRSVNFVLPMRVDGNITLKVFPNVDCKNQDASSVIEDIVEDIRGEIAKTGEVLERLNIKVENVSYDERR
ncbi:hypothetical protein AGMMS50276_00270 [Synergistales bacterium]|nr:hypothetical protein AGMMS50276_00270 [Synergistales bacterium]